MNDNTSTPTLIAISSIQNAAVENPAGDDLGNIEEIMIDLASGHIAYAVLSFGGFLGLGNKLFAIPWEALKLNANSEKVILNVDRKMLKGAPGFDKENWPDGGENNWLAEVYDYYGYRPYWK